MPKSQIDGFDYRLQRPVTHTRGQWKKLIANILKDGGRCKSGRKSPVKGETFVTVPVTEDLGAPFFKRTKQVLAIEIYSTIRVKS